MMYKSSLQFIDGKPAPRISRIRERSEATMYKEYGYTMLPKENVTSITKQDLVDHPEKFEPFIYSPFLKDKYSEIIEIKVLSYNNGKWVFDNLSKNPNYEWEPWMLLLFSTVDELSDDDVLWDVMYMEKHHPELYKKLLQDNGLPETYSQIKESGNKCNPLDLTVKKDSESTTDGECENVSPEASTRSVVSSNGKTHHAVPINITPEQVNVDELPEKITYVKRKVGDGFMFVVEDEQASKVTPGNNGKSVDAAEINYTYIPEPSDLKL